MQQGSPLTSLPLVPLYALTSLVCIVVLDSQRKVFTNSNQSINSQSPSFPSLLIHHLTHLYHLLSQLTMLAGAAFPAAFLTRMSFATTCLNTKLTPIVGGFVLLLLVTLSVPIIKSIHLLVVDFSDGGVRAATIGVFGACYEGIAARSVPSTQSPCVPY